MSDQTRAWLDERSKLHASAEGGGWYAYGKGIGSSGIREDESILEDEYMEEADKDAIVDAHNTLPKLVRGVRKVLDLHRRATDLFEPSEFCASCSTDQRTVEYPCPTVRTIQEAISDE